MQEYVINVTEVEELQTIKDINSLDILFDRAKSTIVNGEKVILVRKTGGAAAQKFDELTTLEDLDIYKSSVYKFL